MLYDFVILQKDLLCVWASNVDMTVTRIYNSSAMIFRSYNV